jgi:hypothetical protein
VLALFTWEYNFTFYIFFRALGTQIGVKVSTFKISFKITEELININPMFKPIQDTRFVVIYILILISHHFGVEIFFVYNSRYTEALVVFHVGCR